MGQVVQRGRAGMLFLYISNCSILLGGILFYNFHSYKNLVGYKKVY